MSAQEEAFATRLAKLQSELDDAREQLENSTEDPRVAQLQREIASLEDDLRREARIAKAKLEALREALKAEKRQVAVLTRKHRNLDRALSKFRKHPPTHARGTPAQSPPPATANHTRGKTIELEDIPAVRRLLLEIGKGGGRHFRGRTVALLGHSPHSASRLRALFAKAGASVTRGSDKNAGILIVGRNGWLADDIEGHIKARSGKVLQICSQEMALLSLSCGHDLFKVATAAALLAMANGHPALQFCIEEGFRWPILDTEKISKALAAIWDDKVEESPLKKLGYAVGVTQGLDPPSRHHLLAVAFKENLPMVESAKYMTTWGSNGSRRRLRRMAHFIAWLIRSRRSNPSMSQAVDDWRSDLGWMQARLYESWMNFRWPDVLVGRAK